MSSTTRPTCPDCGAEEGQFHDHFPLCDQEKCPICLGHFSCPHRDQPAVVRRKGRIRYYCFPLLCARCGTQWPEFFSVPGDTWKRVMPKTHWDAIVCRACFDDLATIAPPENPRKVPTPSCDVDDATLPLFL